MESRESLIVVGVSKELMFKHEKNDSFQKALQ